MILLLPVFLTGLTIRHERPEELSLDNDLFLSCEILDAEPLVVSATVHYRYGADGSFTSLEMYRNAPGDPYFYVLIPASDEDSAIIAYYFSFVLEDGAVQTLPQINPDLNPFLLEEETEPTQTESLILLSPEPGQINGEEPLTAAVSLYAIAGEVDRVEVFFDGRNVTNLARISGNLAVVTVSAPGPGFHTFRIELKLKDGTRLDRSWRMEAEDVSILPFDLEGYVRLEAVTTDTDYEESGSSADSHSEIELGLFGRQDWFSYALRTLFSSRENGRRQPVNRFTLELGAPYVQIIAGDYVPNYNTFVLNNHNIRGIHAGYLGGNLNLLFTTGQSQRAIDGVVRFDEDNRKAIISTGTFTRNTHALRLEMGEQSYSYDSIQFGFSFAKSKDEVGSLDTLFTVNDDSVRVNAPRDNIVAGSDFVVTMRSGRLQLGGEAAFSMLNNDITDGAMSTEELEQYGLGEPPVDPSSWEDIIIINKHLEPFEPGPQNIAWRLFARWNGLWNQMNISFTEVGSAFHSLSASYVANDTRTLSFYDRVNLWNNRMSLYAGYNNRSNNLEGQKEFTDRTHALNAGMHLKPGQRFNLQFHFSLSQSLSDADSILTGGTDQTAMRWGGTVSRAFSFSWDDDFYAGLTFERSDSRDDLNDRFDDRISSISLNTRTRPEDSIWTLWLSQGLSLRDGAYLVSDTNEMLSREDTYYMTHAKIQFDLVEYRLEPYFSGRLTGYEGSRSGTRSTFRIGTGWRPLTNLTLTSEAGYDRMDGDDGFSRINASLSMRYLFH